MTVEQALEVTKALTYQYALSEDGSGNRVNEHLLQAMACVRPGIKWHELRLWVHPLPFEYPDKAREARLALADFLIEWGTRLKETCDKVASA